MFAGGNAPDAIRVNVRNFEKAMLSLDDYVKKYKDFDLGDYIPSVLEAGKWKGKLLQIIGKLDPQVLYSNATKFKEQGLPTPREQAAWALTKNCLRAAGRWRRAPQLQGERMAGSGVLVRPACRTRPWTIMPRPIAPASPAAAPVPGDPRPLVDATREWLASLVAGTGLDLHPFIGQSWVWERTGQTVGRLRRRRG